MDGGGGSEGFCWSGDVEEVDGGGRWTYIVCNPTPRKLYILNYPPPPIFMLFCIIVEVGSKDGQQGIIFTSGEI